MRLASRQGSITMAKAAVNNGMKNWQAIEICGARSAHLANAAPIAHRRSPKPRMKAPSPCVSRRLIFLHEATRSRDRSPPLGGVLGDSKQYGMYRRGS